MKLYRLLIAGMLFSGCMQSVQQNNAAEIKTDTQVVAVAIPEDVEPVIYDLNNDGRLDTITLTTPPVEGDPGLFQTITISFNGMHRQSFKASDVWDFVDSSFLADTKNEVPSKKVFIHKEPGQTLVLLFGYLYGAGRGEFSVIRIRDNKAEMVFDDHLDNPLRLTDFDNDGNVELLGRNDGEMYAAIDSINAQIGVYFPFYIYSFKDSCIIDEAMTQKYNEDNYVWAGLKYSEKIKVAYPNNGTRPYIIE